MPYAQYAEVETQVLEMPYEQQLQLMSVIAENLKNSAEKSKLYIFNALCNEAQNWAEEVGLTSDDIKTTIKQVRAEKKRA